MNMTITSQEQLNQVKAKALFNLKSYCSEFKRYGAERIWVNLFDNEYWILTQYNSIEDLEKVVQGILEDLNLWDCGDGAFFDWNPDNIGIIYQIFRIFQSTGHSYIIDKYKDLIINALNDFFDARQSGECDFDEMDSTYEDYLDNFIHSNFPVTEDTIA